LQEAGFGSAHWTFSLSPRYLVASESSGGGSEAAAGQLLSFSLSHEQAGFGPAHATVLGRRARDACYWNTDRRGLDHASLLVQGSDGNFYGTTGGGGTNNAGTVFKISTNGALTSLYSFTGAMMAQIPKPGWCRAATAISMARRSRRHDRLWHRVQNQRQWGADQFVFLHRRQ
jgi:uncharacterized repeat protein (TIGR03803 family)